MSAVQKKFKKMLSEKAFKIGSSSDEPDDDSDDEETGNEDPTEPKKPEDEEKPKPTRPLHENSSANDFAFYANYQYILALTLVYYICSLL